MISILVFVVTAVLGVFVGIALAEWLGRHR